MLPARDERTKKVTEVTAKMEKVLGHVVEMIEEHTAFSKVEPDSYNNSIDQLTKAFIQGKLKENPSTTESELHEFAAQEVSRHPTDEYKTALEPYFRS